MFVYECKLPRNLFIIYANWHLHFHFYLQRWFWAVWERRATTSVAITAIQTKSIWAPKWVRPLVRAVWIRRFYLRPQRYIRWPECCLGVFACFFCMVMSYICFNRGKKNNEIFFINVYVSHTNLGAAKDTGVPWPEVWLHLGVFGSYWLR